jgi:DNA gyrase/topoisomerase IV subunit A
MPYYENRDVTILDIGTREEPNKYVISGKAVQKNTTTVTVTELPPDMSLETFREKLSALEDEGKITGFTDRSTKTINITVKMTRAKLNGLSNEALVEFLKLRTTATENIVVQGVGGSNIITYDSIEKLVKDWVEWRLGLYLDRFEKLLADEKATNLFWRYVIACFDGFDAMEHPPMSVYARTATVLELRDYIGFLGKMHKLPKAPAELIDRIMNLPIFRWTADGQEKAQAEYAESNHRLANYKEMVDSDRLRKALFKREVSALK